MKCLELGELPPPSTDRRGWPWTTEPATFSPARSWPKISIIVPSFNQGRYLEETIRSVLLQGYPNLEFFIIDGGSTDESVAIIRKYERWLTGWVSERDRGQSEAINKGFDRCRGEIVNWLCSDDLLTPGSLIAVAQAFSVSPECDVVVGKCHCKHEGHPERDEISPSSTQMIQENPYVFAVWQPSCFFRRSLIKRPYLVRDDMHFCMDRELWCYLREQGARWRETDEILSVNRFTGENKSTTGEARVIDELDRTYRFYAGDRVPLTFWLRRIWLPLVMAHATSRSWIVRALSRPVSRLLTLALRLLYPSARVQALQKEYYRYTAYRLTCAP